MVADFVRCHFLSFFCIFVFLYFCIFVFLSFYLSVFLSFCLFVLLSFCLFVFLSRHHSDQMPEGSEVSKVALCAKILKWHSLTHQWSRSGIELPGQLKISFPQPKISDSENIDISECLWHRFRPVQCKAGLFLVCWQVDCFNLGQWNMIFLGWSYYISLAPVLGWSPILVGRQQSLISTVGRPTLSTQCLTQ